MTSSRRTRPRAYIAILALCAVVVIFFFSAMPWLKQQTEELVFLISGVLAASVIGASFVLDVLHDRGMDEWQRANQRFSMKWGWGIGSAIVALCVGLPFFHDVLVHWAAIWGDTPNPDRRLVITTFMAGFICVIVAQTIAMALISIGWTLWKSRPARDRS